MLNRLMANYADEILAIILGFVSANVGYQCFAAAASDSVQYVIHGLSDSTIDLVKYILPTLCGFIGTIGGLYVKYKIAQWQYKKDARKKT